MALTDLTRISTSGIATGTSLSGAILHGDAHFRGTQVGVNSAIFDSSDDALELNDNVKLKFGNDGDLEIGHINDQNIIEDKGNGALILKTNGSAISLQRNTGATMLSAVPEQDVRLFFNGNQKLNTTNDGVVVTGILTASSFSGPIGNPSGISTFYDLRVSNNLTVEGTTTTLDTNLIGVDRVEVGANSNTVTGIAVTQSGTADIVRLYDGSTQVVTVDDTGKVGIGSAIPTGTLTIHGLNGGNPGIMLRRDTGGGDIASISWGSNTSSFAKINYRDAAPHGLQFYSGGTASSNLSMIIRLNGNVGIGSEIPTDKLDIQTGSSDEVTKFKVKTQGKLELTRNHASAPYIKTFMSSGNPAIHLGDSSGDKAVIKIDGDSYLNGGNFGIGNTTPTAKLDVTGTVKATNFVGALPISNDSNNRVVTATGSGGLDAEANLTFSGSTLKVNSTTGHSYLKLNSNDSYSGSIHFGDQSDDDAAQIWYDNYQGNGMYFRTSENTPMSFYTNNSPRLKITSGGGLQFRNADTPTNNSEPALILNHAGGWQFYASSDTSTHNNIIFGTNSVSAGERLRITNAGRVGINSAIPEFEMDVMSPTGVTNTTLCVKGRGSGYSQLRLEGEGGASENYITSTTVPLSFYVGSGNQKAKIDTGGRFLIGAGGADHYLHIKQNAETTYAKIETTHSSSTYTGINLRSPTLNFQIWNQGPGATGYAGANSVNFWQAASTGPYAFYHGNTERLRIDTSGQVSIGGNTSVGTKLHIENSSGDAHIRLRGSVNYGVLFTRHSDAALLGFIGSGGAVNVGSSNLGITAGLSGGSIVLQTGGTASSNERVRIKSDGNVGINQTDPSRAKLHVVGGNANPEIVAKFKGSSGTDARTKIGLVAAYSDTANDAEGHVYMGALRGGNGNSSRLFFEVSSGTTLKETARVDESGFVAGGSYRFHNGSRTGNVMPNSHNIGDVSSNSISYFHNAGIYYVFATIPTDGNWYTMMTSFNDSASNFRGVCGDASSKNSFYWYFNPTSPSYGVNPYGEKWHHGAWNTGSVTFRLDGTHPNWNLQIKCTSHYGTNRTAALRAIMEVYY